LSVDALPSPTYIGTLTAEADMAIPVAELKDKLPEIKERLEKLRRYL
jgi:hypothetical protein